MTLLVQHTGHSDIPGPDPRPLRRVRGPGPQRDHVLGDEFLLRGGRTGYSFRHLAGLALHVIHPLQALVKEGIEGLAP